MRKDVRNDLICIKARASRMVNVNSPHATAQADFTQHSPPANNHHTSPAGSSLNAHNWKLTNPPSPAAPVSARSRQSQPMARLDWPVPFHWPHTLADPCVTASIHPAWEASPERVNGGGGTQAKVKNPLNGARDRAFRQGRDNGARWRRSGLHLQSHGTGPQQSGLHAAARTSSGGRKAPLFAHHCAGAFPGRASCEPLALPVAPSRRGGASPRGACRVPGSDHRAQCRRLRVAQNGSLRMSCHSGCLRSVALVKGQSGTILSPRARTSCTM